jgi:hypothetical protein
MQQRDEAEEGRSHPSVLLAATTPNEVFTDKGIEDFWFLSTSSGQQLSTYGPGTFCG